MRTGTIIFILVIAWSVLNAIISHLAAKKKQEQETERLRARRSGAQGGGAATTASQAGASPRTKMDDLIARRKAQIEELRAQREARRGRTPAEVRVGESHQARPQIRDVGVFEAPAPLPTPSSRQSTTARPVPVPGRPPAQTMPGRSVPGRPVGPSGQPDLSRARQEAQRRIREAQQQRQRAEQARKDQEQKATRLRERADAREADRAADAILVGTPYAASHGSQTAARVRKRLGDVHSLRELFLLKEVLDRPVSLRE